MNIPLWRRRDPLAADRLNQTTGAVNTHLPIIGGAGILVGGGGAGGTVVSLASGDDSLPDGVFRVKNMSGGFRSRFDIMGLDGPLIDATTNLVEFQNNIGFKGVVPLLSTHFRRWGVLLEPLNAGESGLIRITGVAVAKVNIVNPSDVGAGMTDSTPGFLTSSPDAASTMLLPHTSTGMMWQYIRMVTSVQSEELSCSV